MEIILAIVGLLVTLIAVLLIRTARFSAPVAPECEPTPVAGDAEAVAQRLSGAIRFKTISFPEQERIDGSQFFGLHEHLKKSYQLVASQLQWEAVKDYSLLLKWPGKGGSKPTALLAHQDVVPVNPGTESDWAYDAYSGHIDNTQVWGRGTIDMKGHLISVLEAVESLLAEGFQPQSDVYLCFGHNEEVVSADNSGAMATMELLRDRGIKLDLIVDEGGVVIPGKQMLGMDGLVAVVGTAEKGYMDVRLTCTQDGGHSSQPPKSSALGILARAVTKIEQSPAKSRLIGTVETMLLTAGRHMAFGQRLIFANLWLFRPLLLKVLSAKPLTNALIRTTRAVTMASGSPAPNVLPQKAEVTVNIRLLPGDTMEQEVERLRRIIADDRIVVEPLKGKNPSNESPTNTDSYRLIKQSLERMYPGVVVAPYLMIGGTDSCMYEPVCENIYRIAPFLIGQEELKMTHGTNERISKENLMRGVEFFRSILINR